MTKKELAAVKRKLVAAQRRIAKERDALRDLISDAEGLADSCDRADGNLQDAIDALSELV